MQTLLSLQSAAVAQGAQPEPESSGGQSALVPVQYSGTSHGPANGRHTVLAGRKLSLGHVLLVPSQVSATSHTPAAGRHTVPAGLFASAGQLAPVPEQVSGGSQMPADARHTVPAAAKASAGHSRLVPLHVSGTSQGPAEGRHTVPAFPGRFSQNFTPPIPLTHLSTVHGFAVVAVCVQAAIRGRDYAVGRIRVRLLGRYGSCRTPPSAVSRPRAVPAPRTSRAITSTATSSSSPPSRPGAR